MHQQLPTPPDSSPEPSTSASVSAPSSPPLEPSTSTGSRRTPSFHLVLPLPRPASTPLLSSTSPSALLLASFYPSTSPEAQAHEHIHEHILHDPQIGAKEMGLSSAYAAVQRYLAAEDLYIFPTDGKSLSDVLGRFARDVIHSLISQAKTRIEEGGYTRARAIAMKSLRDKVLTPTGTATLLELHRHLALGGLSLGPGNRHEAELTPSLSRESSNGSVSGDSEGEEVRTPGSGSGSMTGREKMRMTMTRVREGGGKEVDAQEVVIADEA
ncbi:hypothetical protein CALCODRAFT_429193 [Calocera cornea HHB12733]|uniref:Uncharacterized protein n=1 Tax=Calocera cornea HHB12733 TaxID=1353952 RepID=A0A165IGS8_9BASI|nr:hypothetical protein CALCODRAFT_429193 [Calocera cornea HHB12733]